MWAQNIWKDLGPGDHGVTIQLGFCSSCFMYIKKVLGIRIPVIWESPAADLTF